MVLNCLTPEGLELNSETDGSVGLKTGGPHVGQGGLSSLGQTEVLHRLEDFKHLRFRCSGAAAPHPETPAEEVHLVRRDSREQTPGETDG